MSGPLYQGSPGSEQALELSVKGGQPLCLINTVDHYLEHYIV